MKLDKLLEAYSNPNITPELATKFNNIFKTIKNNVKEVSDFAISPKWVSGFLNQAHLFQKLDQDYIKYKNQGNANMANDTLARITTRNTLERIGLLAGGKIIKPKTISLMKQYYTQPIHDENELSDPGKLTRSAAEMEYSEWINTLSEKEQNYVYTMQEINPEELANFKGVVNAKESKKEFKERLLVWLQSDDIAYKLFQNIGLINDEGTIDISEVENFRSFLDTLSIPRIKDILSKASVYTGKMITHDTHRAKNAVLKDIEQNAGSIYSRIISTYNSIAPLVASNKDKRKAIIRALQKVSGTIEGGRLTTLGKGVILLYKQFGGNQINNSDIETATTELNNAYQFPAPRDRRNKKAETRGENIKNIAKV